MDIRNLIGEATAYDKKQLLEVKRPKSWLKSVSAFANGEGGTLIFGVSDEGQVVGLAEAESDAERISEEIKTKLDPVPVVNLELKEIDGKRLVLLHVCKGQETPYYYVGDKQRLAYVRVGNESVVADRLQLKSLVLRGAGRSFDAIPSPYKFEDMSFSKLKSVHFKRLSQSFDDSDFVSWGIVDNDRKLTLGHYWQMTLLYAIPVYSAHVGMGLTWRVAWVRHWMMQNLKGVLSVSYRMRLLL